MYIQQQVSEITRLESPLRNQYVTLRHGESAANVARVVASSPALGVPKFGLTSQGIAQVQTSVRNYLTNNPAPEVLYSSDFSRARHTADIAAQAGIGGGLVRPAYELRERHFGEHDGGSADCYTEVWKRDADDIHHKWGDVESVADVAIRMLALIKRLEEQHENCTIVLVGHADPLKIAHAALQGMSPGAHHCALPLMGNAEFWPMSYGDEQAHA
ncbi:MAG: histidine phosphatase family protein [Corynebacteriales bacterium]|nr:histidine phosphatase family protein [Mycobacteriales bacterium]